MKAGWQTRKLGDVCDFEGGSQPPKSQFIYEEKPGYVRFLQIRDFGSDKNITYISESKKNRLCKENDILIGRYGASVGKILTNKAGAYNVALMKAIPNLNLLEWSWFYNYLVSDEFQSRLLNIADRSAQAGFSKDDIYNFPVPVPSRPEQQRIVGILDAAFDGVATTKANAEQNLQNARALFESHLQSVFTQRGEGWIERLLSELCVVDWGNTDLTKSAYVDGGKFLAVSAAGCDGRIGHKEHKKFTPVLSAIGAQCGRMFLPEEDFTASKNTITLTPRDGMCLNRFLYRLLTHIELPKRGAAQPFIAKGDIQTFRVRVPVSLSEQERLADAFDSLEQETQRLESLYQRKLAALAELKKSLLHQAFSGAL